MNFARTLVLLLVVSSPLSATSEGDLVDVLQTLYLVYDAAGLLESLSEDGKLPKIGSAAELSHARFGSEEAADQLVDPWGTPLHIESIPGRGYVIAAAGSDLRFDRSSWDKAAKTKSTADDVVLRDGALVRSPEEWVNGLVNLTADRLQKEVSRSAHARTLADVRAIAVAMMAYEIDEGKLPSVSDIDGLAEQLEPVYMAKVPRADGWGQRLDLAMGSTLDFYFLISAGPDRELDTSDDIVLKDHEFIQNGEAAAPDPLVDAWTGYQAARHRLESAR